MPNYCWYIIAQVSFCDDVIHTCIIRIGNRDPAWGNMIEHYSNVDETPEWALSCGNINHVVIHILINKSNYSTNAVIIQYMLYD